MRFWLRFLPAIAVLAALPPASSGKLLRLAESFPCDVKFVFAGWLLLAELDGNDNVLRTYTWGPGPGGIGGLLAVKDHATGKTCCPVYDGNGNGMAEGKEGQIGAKQ